MRRVAVGRGVAGSAVNRADGSVEVVLEGGCEDVEAVIAYCAEGPDRAEVSAVEVESVEPCGAVGFEIG